MATCIHSSRSCLPPFYTIPIFPLLNRKIFHLLVSYLFFDVKINECTYCLCMRKLSVCVISSITKLKSDRVISDIIIVLSDK